MRDILQSKLYSMFPKLFAGRMLPISQSCMPFGIECGDGWFQVILKMCKELSDHIATLTTKEAEWLYFSSIKEKYGMLSVDMVAEDPEVSDIISNAEMKSQHTCEICGFATTAKLRPGGYIRTLCNTCFKQDKIKT